MEFAEVVRGRRMTRSYDPDRPIPRQTVTGLLRLAIKAPSAGHTQGWHFLVLDDITSRDRFWTATSDGEPDRWRSRMAQAPVLIICMSDKSAYLDRYAEPDKGWTDRDEARWPVPYWHIDTGMASMILLLAAQDAGLAACFFGVPGERWTALREAFAIPDRLDPVGVVSLGYPAPTVSLHPQRARGGDEGAGAIARAPDVRSPSLRRGRRGVDEVVSYGSFGVS